MKETTEKKVRVRFAPSPTGYLHVGGLRTALYNYLFTKKNGGEFVLRIEDTDRTRFVEGAVENLIGALQDLKLEWDEGTFTSKAIPSDEISVYGSTAYPGIFEVGDLGPYVQSERLDLYKKYAKQLVAESKAYPCFCTSERLEEMRQTQIANKQAPMYDRCCLDLSEQEVQSKLAAGEPHVLRFKVPHSERVEFVDLVRGKVVFEAKTIDDQVLLKSDGFPTYHLANVVDDHLMEITQVIRGEEWLPSTPKHILLYQALGWEIPQFAHLPLLLNPDKSKLSKRQGDVAVEDYLNKGYLPAALLNFVALLGWNPGAGSTQEIFSLEDLKKEFELSKVHKAGAVFDLKKLDWINGQYIKQMPVADLQQAVLPYLAQKEFYQKASEEFKTPAYLQKVLTIEKERLLKLTDVGEENQFFFTDIEYSAEMLKWKEMATGEVRENLQKAEVILEKVGNWELATLEAALLAAAGDKRGQLLWPLRVALTGAEKSPSPFEVAWVLGKSETIKRIEAALAKL